MQRRSILVKPPIITDHHQPRLPQNPQMLGDQRRWPTHPPRQFHHRQRLPLTQLPKQPPPRRVRQSPRQVLYGHNRLLGGGRRVRLWIHRHFAVERGFLHVGRGMLGVVRGIKEILRRMLGFFQRFYILVGRIQEIVRRKQGICRRIKGFCRRILGCCRGKLGICRRTLGFCSGTLVP